MRSGYEAPPPSCPYCAALRSEVERLTREREDYREKRATEVESLRARVAELLDTLRHADEAMLGYIGQDYRDSDISKRIAAALAPPAVPGGGAMKEPILTKFYVTRDPWRQFDFALYATNVQARSAAQPLVFAPSSPAARIEPFAIVSQVEAQGLMDALWDAGVRPVAGHGSAGERAAMERHLNDMRRIAFLYVDGGKP